MKAEQRKEIETNSLVLLVQRIRKNANWRTVYYIVGAIALIVTGIILYRYFTSESGRARDAILEQLAAADTVEKLKQGIEDHRGTVYGSLFKLHLARHLLKTEGLPKLGTDRWDPRTRAADNIEQARTYYLELTGELKEKDQASLVQEAWIGAAQAEEALVGLPKTEGGSDSRGDVNKAIEYYEKAGSIFADTDFSKRYKERAEKLTNTKDEFVAAQKAFYKPIERPTFPTGKNDPLGPGLPPIPGGPKIDIPGGPVIPPPPKPTEEGNKVDPNSSVPPKVELPPIPPVPTPPEPKKSEPSKVEPKPADPKSNDSPKADPKKS
jgi:hypothetical protein